jgi:hypothetical protein
MRYLWSLWAVEDLQRRTERQPHQMADALWSAGACSCFPAPGACSRRKGPSTNQQGGPKTKQGRARQWACEPPHSKYASPVLQSNRFRTFASTKNSLEKVPRRMQDFLAIRACIDPVLTPNWSRLPWDHSRSSSWSSGQTTREHGGGCCLRRCSSLWSSRTSHSSHGHRTTPR